MLLIQSKPIILYLIRIVSIKKTKSTIYMDETKENIFIS